MLCFHCNIQWFYFKGVDFILFRKLFCLLHTLQLNTIFNFLISNFSEILSDIKNVRHQKCVCVCLSVSVRLRNSCHDVVGPPAEEAHAASERPPSADPQRGYLTALRPQRCCVHGQEHLLRPRWVPYSLWNLFPSHPAHSPPSLPLPPPGCTGLEELLGIEPAFLEFQDTLFSGASLTLERSVLSREVNDKLDTGISLFLTRLSPYFLLKPAHKCLEWLVHRYAAQIWTKDERALVD